MGVQRFYGPVPILFRRSFRAAPGLPKLISVLPQGVMLFGIVSGGVHAIPSPGVLMLVFCVQVGLIGVLQG